VGEFMIMLGTFTASIAHAHVYGIVAAVGVIVGAMYLLHWTRNTIWGQLTNAKNKVLQDLDKREILVLTSIALLTLFMGVASPYFLNKTAATTAAIIQPLNPPATEAAAAAPAAMKPAATLPHGDAVASLAGGNR